LKEIYVNDGNPFKDPENHQKKEIVKRYPGSPIFYREYSGGAYIIWIIKEFLEFQYFDKDDLLFLNDMINQGYYLRKKIHIRDWWR